MRVAVVGMGRMGAAMARRLAAEADHDLIVFNRTPTRRGGRRRHRRRRRRDRSARPPRPRKSWSCRWPTTLRSLTTYRGDDGLLAGLRGRARRLRHEHRRAGDDRAALAAEVAERGAYLLDTPVSGSVPVVESGQLTVMAGGDAGLSTVAQPVLDVISKQTFHLGDVGCRRDDEASRQLDDPRAERGGQ